MDWIKIYIEKHKELGDLKEQIANEVKNLEPKHKEFSYDNYISNPNNKIKIAYRNRLSLFVLNIYHHIWYYGTEEQYFKLKEIDGLRRQ